VGPQPDLRPQYRSVLELDLIHLQHDLMIETLAPDRPELLDNVGLEKFSERVGFLLSLFVVKMNYSKQLVIAKCDDISEGRQ
jgi:hypothetical protein